VRCHRQRSHEAGAVEQSSSSEIECTVVFVGSESGDEVEEEERKVVRNESVGAMLPHAVDELPPHSTVAGPTHSSSPTKPTERAVQLTRRR